MKTPSQRQLRAGELVRRTIAELLSEGAVKDPAVLHATITVSEARMSPDLRYATVYVAAMGEAAEAAAVAMNRAAGFIQHELSERTELRWTPKLTFKADDRFDEAVRIDEILDRDGVKRDLGGCEED